MPPVQTISLACGALRLQLAPAVGGSIARFYSSGVATGDSREVDWLRPATRQALEQCDPLGMASFPLLPFCNRIRDGRATFEGREIRFPPNHPSVNSPHPLHGIGWQRPWTLVSDDGRSAKLSLDVPASEAWPWAFTALQHLVLDEQALHVTMTLTNRDSAAMPAGIGHHPYFPHTHGTRLTTATKAMWQGDSEVMPTTLEVSQAVQKLRTGVSLSELDLDNNFVGWERDALVEWPPDGSPARSLRLQAQAPLDFFVLYCPRGADHFCAEPVSQCTDWLNLLPHHDHSVLGGARLAPAESLHAQFSLTPRWG